MSFICKVEIEIISLLARPQQHKHLFTLNIEAEASTRVQLRNSRRPSCLARWTSVALSSCWPALGSWLQYWPYNNQQTSVFNFGAVLVVLEA